MVRKSHNSLLVALAAAVGLLSSQAAAAGVNYTGVSQTGLEIPANPQLPNSNVVARLISKGANAFRFPILWESIQPGLNGALSTTFLAKLDAAIAYVAASGVAIIDIHNNATFNGVSLANGGASANAFGNLWSQIATQYKNNPSVWFGLMNAPDMRTNGCTDSQLWFPYVDKAITAIRLAGATNKILVPSGQGSRAETWQWPCTNGDIMAQITDNNFAFDMQQYFTADGSPTFGTCTKIASTLSNTTTWLRTNRKTAFLSAFSVNWDDSSCRNLLGSYLSYFDDNSDVWLGWTYWAGGPNVPANTGFYYVDSISDATDSTLFKLLSSFFARKSSPATTDTSGDSTRMTIIVVSVVVVGALILGAITVVIVLRARSQTQPKTAASGDEDAGFKPIKKRGNTDRKSMMEERELRDAVKQMMLTNNVPFKEKPETRTNTFAGKRMRLDAASATETFQAKNVNNKDTDSGQFSHFVNFTSSRFQVESQAANNDEYLF
ncbi:glycoside hydrolase superfamily [Entophlyctis helioformis]|nr:glycoside hydrolase superfamily [Entophlyctis helioformis]